jgi:hypothetical protein
MADGTSIPHRLLCAPGINWKVFVMCEQLKKKDIVFACNPKKVILKRIKIEEQ